MTDRWGIPVAAALDVANRHDLTLLEPTLRAAGWRGLLQGIETLHLDRGYDSAAARRLCADAGIADVACPQRRSPGAAGPRPVPLGRRWSIERTNSWLSNFGQLRRNADRRPHHRRAQLALAIACILTAKLINHRNRWNPNP